jgi:hypothetical protein
MTRSPARSRRRTARLIAAAALIACAGAAGAHALAQQPSAGAPDALTPAERSAGWRLLFDGRTTAGWRGYRQQAVPPRWEVVDGVLTCAGGGGDLVSVERFDHFELALDWRIAEGGNSGIMFRVGEDGKAPYFSGPEFQLLDNARHADGKNPVTAAGSNYALHAPARDVTRPVGAWNEVRLLVQGSHVEHWMNGEKIVEYELGSPEWAALVAGSKFKQWPEYGRLPSGHIVLQDHGDRVAFRNIRIRPLPAR